MDYFINQVFTSIAKDYDLPVLPYHGNPYDLLENVFVVYRAVLDDHKVLNLYLEQYPGRKHHHLSQNDDVSKLHYSEKVEDAELNINVVTMVNTLLKLLKIHLRRKGRLFSKEEMMSLWSIKEKTLLLKLNIASYEVDALKEPPSENTKLGQYRRYSSLNNSNLMKQINTIMQITNLYLMGKRFILRLDFDQQVKAEIGKVQTYLNKILGLIGTPYNRANLEKEFAYYKVELDSPGKVRLIYHQFWSFYNYLYKLYFFFHVIRSSFENNEKSRMEFNLIIRYLHRVVLRFYNFFCKCRVFPVNTPLLLNGGPKKQTREEGIDEVGVNYFLKIPYFREKFAEVLHDGHIENGQVVEVYECGFKTEATGLKSRNAKCYVYYDFNRNHFLP